MKITHYLLLGWAFIGCLSACKEDPTPPQPGIEESAQQGDVTEIGQPQGEAVSKSIGPGGGTIATPDGKVRLVLPAGAVDKPTNISIQPITNKTPNGIGQAYRFSPDGTQFAKPATLTFQYTADDVAINQPDVFGIAYQREDQAWYAVEGASVDTTKRQISVPMKHFSDWSAFELFQIENLKLTSGERDYTGALAPGESVTLHVSELSMAQKLSNQPAGEQPLILKDYGRNWQLHGEGKLTVDGFQATYTAPSAVPKQNPVSVSVEVVFQNSKRKVILLSRIWIGDNYFKGFLNGTAFTCPVTHYAAAGNSLHIFASDVSEVPNFHVILTGNPASPEGEYIYGEGSRRPLNTVAYDESYPNGGYLTHFLDCALPPKFIYSPGSVIIKRLERKNGRETIVGTLSATLYRAIDAASCDAPKEYKLVAEFRIDRAQ